ncbi:hypothetical protein, partial [Pseudomonas lijiangensis]
MSTASSVKHSIPKTLDAWIKHLDAVDLPIPSVNHNHVRDALKD